MEISYIYLTKTQSSIDNNDSTFFYKIVHKTIKVRNPNANTKLRNK